VRLLLLVAATLILPATPKPVFTDPAVTLLGAPSPDGRLLSLVEHGDLAIRDISTGQSTRLTKATGKQFAYFSSISRDSQTVAYAWFNDEGFYELRVLPVSGGQPRTLFKNPEAGFVQPTAWTPGNEFILTLLFRKDNVSQIALIPAGGGEPRILRSLNWVYPKRMDISPDGKTLLYDSFAPGSTSQRTIYSLSLDGAVETQLTPEPGNHSFPLYAPDGQSIYYLSDNTLMQRAHNGPPRVVQADMGRALPLGITNGNVLYYGLRTGLSDVFLADPANPGAPPRRASIKYPNRNLAPSFSPDGKRLAYLSRRGAENFGQQARAVVIRSLSSDDETELPVKMAHIELVHWRPDGQALYLGGSDGRGRGGIFEFDLVTKRTRPLRAEIGGPPKGFVFYPTPTGYVYRDGDAFKDDKGQPAPAPKPGPITSPDGRTIATVISRDSQQIWSLVLQPGPRKGASTPAPRRERAAAGPAPAHTAYRPQTSSRPGAVPVPCPPRRS
jgi:Tol biopolymer transport system component